MKYLLGCDPELGVYNKQSERWLSAKAFVRGTKEEPFIVEGGATQLDGVLAEFNIHPVDREDDWVENINLVISQLYLQVGNSNVYDLRAEPVLEFEPYYFSLLSDKEKELGCKPDFNAYTGEQNEPPVTDQPFRTCSGHIHFGYDLPEDYANDVRARVKQLDASLYLSSLLWDNNTKRRTLYGRPGAFRYKPYGFEYRVLSNKWVGDEHLQRWVYAASIRAMDLYDQGVYLFDDEDDQETMEALFDTVSLIEYHHELCTTYRFPFLPAKHRVKLAA